MRTSSWVRAIDRSRLGPRRRAAPVRSADRCQVCGERSWCALSTADGRRRCLPCWMAARQAAQQQADRPRWPTVAPGAVTVHPCGALVCHHCGIGYVDLARHARSAHGLTADGYRARFGLSADVDLRAPRHRDQEPARCPGCGEDRLISYDATAQGRCDSAAATARGCARAQPARHSQRRADDLL